MNTSVNPSQQASSILPHHLQGQGSSLSAKRMDHFDPALITVPLMTSPSDTLFRWWQQPSNCRGPQSSHSWICVMPITSSASGKEMSGSRHSTRLQVTGNTWWCRSGKRMPLPSSRVWLMTYSEIWSTSLSLFTLTTSSSSPRTWRNTNTMFARSYSENKLFVKAKKCFPAPLPPSWDISPLQATSAWILRRSRW